ncbi:hypothetical protein ATCM_10380 [Stenotrophomonas sp. ATCM1_4]|uniref:DUF4097 family beta strand repeat-containing protein n=1 Tax=Stenotrophomonas capsici TaxID=3110230 RepID=A0ABU5UZF5_9GAMM|nr:MULTISPECIES: DUF4097 family beta strand repeat-containing protein [unclassified Stenotrophomonas]MEA5666436.1 DUF4097 family beta strand repeat-containing protein [Stenotrophomonas sp. MH1]TDB28034.1 hypothetical protein ATCM_10380 [Stenotrophomonas sp. ATCM1_4]
MNASLRNLLAATLLLAPIASVFAQSTVNQRLPLSSGGRVELGNVAGSVTVRGWDRNEVQLTGTLGDGQRLDVENSANRVQFKVVYPQNSRNTRGAVLELRVPRSAQLQASTVSASIDVGQVDLRRLQATSVSGSITAEGQAGETDLNTVSGAIRSQLRTPRLDLQTVSGQINVAGSSGGEVSANSVSGAIDLNLSAVQRLTAETVSGSLGVRSAGLAPGGRINLQTVSGGVSLTLPARTSAQLKANSFSGSIQSDVGTVERPQYGPGRSLETRLGGGDGDISISSHSGSVRVRLGDR